RIGDRAVSAVALSQCVVERKRWIELDLTEKRIRGVNGFHLDKRGLAIWHTGHRAQGSRAGNLSMRLQERAFVRRDFALNQRECQIPAENDAALARKTISEARRYRSHAGYRHAAERDAEDKHVKAIHAVQSAEATNGSSDR